MHKVPIALALCLVIGNCMVINVAADCTISSEEICDRSILKEDLGPGSVVNKKIADGAVTGDKIADKTITANKLADGVLTAGPTGPPGSNALLGVIAYDESNDKVSDSDLCVLGDFLGTGAHCVYANCPDPSNQVLVGGACECPIVTESVPPPPRKLQEFAAPSSPSKRKLHGADTLVIASQIAQAGIKPWKLDANGKQLYRYICECTPPYFENVLNDDEVDGSSLFRRLLLVAASELPGYDPNWEAIASAYCITV